MKIPTALLLLAIASPFAQAADVSTCLAQAAADQKIPPLVLESLAIEQMDEPSESGSDKGFGLLGLTQKTIGIAAREIQASPRSIAIDPCFNAKAGAWWLAKQGIEPNRGDVWLGVATFLYGSAKRDSYPRVEAVKSIYADITRSPLQAIADLRGFDNPQFTAARCSARLRREAVADFGGQNVVRVEEDQFQTPELGELECSGQYVLADGAPDQNPHTYTSHVHDPESSSCSNWWGTLDDATEVAAPSDARHAAPRTKQIRLCN